MNDPNSQRRRRRIATTLLIGFLAGLFGVAVNKARSFEMMMVPSGSMSPTIAAGDRLIVDKDWEEPPARAEIWVFRMPTGGLAVKRVIGLPGETIAVHDGRVWIDGEPLDEPYPVVSPTYDLDELKLDDDQYFVLGDQRNASADSHLWGPVRAEKFVGRARARCWPPSRTTGL